MSLVQGFQFHFYLIDTDVFISMTYNEEYEHLKNIADQVPKKYREQLKLIRSQNKNFRGKYWLLSSIFNTNREFTGKVSFIPKKVRVMSSEGNLNLYISCDVIFEDVKVDNLDLKEIVGYDLTFNDLDRISNMFNEAPHVEFEKLVRLIGMDNFKLDINDIVVK